MLSAREILKTVSNSSFGYFAGHSIGSHVFDSSLKGLLGTGLFAVTGSIAFSYVAWCAEDDTHRKITDYKNLLKFLDENFRGLYGIGPTAFAAFSIPKLARFLTGNDISYTTAIQIVSLVMGGVTRELANQIDEDERAANRRPRL